MTRLQLAAVERTHPGPPPVPALSDATLDLEPGGYYAITGPSGSGKSTLLNVLGLLDRPTGGSYHVDGTDVAALRDADVDALRSRTFGFVFQASHVLGHWSVGANVALSLRARRVPRGDRPQAVASVLDAVGLTHRRAAVARTLSGGERQRVAIARALVGGPSVVLADEPTGNLDSENAAAVMELLESAHANGVTLVIVTHDPQVAARATVRIPMRDGVAGRGRAA